MHEMLVEDTVLAFQVLMVLPFVWDQRIGKCQCLFFDLNDLICIVYFTFALDQHDLIKIPSPVRDRGGFSLRIRFQPEHVEMPDVVPDILRKPIEFPFVKFFK
jgi:hypothetical protein